jgi:hypothetical protein
MKSQNLIPVNTSLTSSKRREDVTVAELKDMPCFATHSDEELASIIEAAKIFSRAVVTIHAKETANRKGKAKSKTIDLNKNLQKKAA